MLQIEKTKMVCLVFEPGPQDGRRRRNHGAMAAAKKNVTQANIFGIQPIRRSGRFFNILAKSWKP